MIFINQGNYREIIMESDKPLVIEFIKKNGCSNCEQMKPIMNNFEQANPHLNVAVFECESGADVPKEFQFRVFPGIYSFFKGNLVRSFCGIKTPQELAMLLSSDRDIMADLYALPKRIEFLEKILGESGRDAGLVAPIEYNQNTDEKPRKPKSTK